MSHRTASETIVANTAHQKCTVEKKSD